MWQYKDFGFDYFRQIPIGIGDTREFMGNTFYSCNYLCPECHSHLLKSNIKRQFKGQIMITTDKGNKSFSSVFYCRNCKKLYTTGLLGGFNGGVVQLSDGSFVPMTGTGATLAEGKVFVLTDPEEVQETLIAIDKEFGVEVEAM